ncbi:DUF5131 family protein [Candidatus Atribacteria bacterium 1244-E10-H5-B2]|nr:MAG: DUF5131 family protein [Candidatus Atribacteria bacterium 1244-E10-H5-B2]
MKNKIGWCSMTFNPCWGCLNHCEYCYARKIAKRFWKQRYMEECNYQFKLHPDWVWTGDHLSGLKDFKPTWLESKFNKKMPKKPQRIFVGSMSEIAYWREEWVEKVIEKVRQYPQHTFQFLTKYPNDVYFKYNFPKNCWLGITVTKETDMHKNDWNYLYGKNIYFISFEPLLEEINLHFLDHRNINWVIIGFQTNPFKKIEEKAVVNIIEYTRENNIPLFLKNSIYKGYPDLPIIKEFPE